QAPPPPVGAAGGCRRRGGVPRLAGIGLRQRHGAGRRRGVALAMSAREQLGGGGVVIPVVVVNAADDAAPLGAALARGGLSSIEVTLRTPAALAAIERLAGD